MLAIPSVLISYLYHLLLADFKKILSGFTILVVMSKYSLDSIRPDAPPRSRFLDSSFILESDNSRACMRRDSFFQKGTIPCYAIAAVVCLALGYGYQQLSERAASEVTNNSQKPSAPLAIKLDISPASESMPAALQKQ